MMGPKNTNSGTHMMTNMNDFSISTDHVMNENKNPTTDPLFINASRNLSSDDEFGEFQSN